MRTYEMKHPRSENDIEPRALSDAELDQISGGFILGGPFPAGFFVGYGAARLAESLGEKGTLNALPR